MNNDKGTKELIYQLYPSAWVEQPGSKNAFDAMKQHLSRIQKLGVTTIWISPFYPTGPDLYGGFGCDGGYDVADYCAVDSRFGTLMDFDDLVVEANRLGMKVIIDLVLNHTSTSHPWFQASRKREDRFEDYYLWSRGDLGWNNQFNGDTAFKFDKERNEYYLHLFHEEQADLNWKSPYVRLEFKKIIDFWTKKHGVAGFRLDVPIFISKRFTRTWVPRCLGMFAGLSHYYMRKSLLPIFHSLFDGRNLLIIAESGAPFRFLFDRLFSEKNPAITLAFNAYLPFFINKHFGMIPAWRSPKRWTKAVQRWSKDSHLAVTTESHDLPRFTSQSLLHPIEIFRRVVAANPRAICIYQGQELGLKNPDLSYDISDYSDAQTIMRYEKAIKKEVGMKWLEQENPKHYETLLAEYQSEHPHISEKMRAESRENARQPLNLTEYESQMKSNNSIWTSYRELIQEWKNMG